MIGLKHGIIQNTRNEAWYTCMQLVKEELLHKVRNQLGDTTEKQYSFSNMIYYIRQNAFSEYDPDVSLIIAAFNNEGR